MQQNYACRAIGALTSGFILLSGLCNPPAHAGRFVLNQSPTTIEGYFGHYWTRLSRPSPDGKTYVTYTYSPALVRRLFPGFGNSKFSMTYVDDRAQYIDIGSGSNPIPYGPTQAARFFRYIFGYEPPTRRSLYWKRLYVDNGEPVNTYHSLYCLGDGIATGVDWVKPNAPRPLAINITLQYDARCGS